MSILEFALKLAHKVRIYFGRYILKMSLIHQKFYSLGEYIYIYIYIYIKYIIYICNIYMQKC